MEGICRFLTPSSSLVVSKLVDAKRLPHLLFYGPPGTGKTSTILALARKLYGSAVNSLVLEVRAFSSFICLEFSDQSSSISCTL